MNKISVVIITHNEERNIERCIQSVAEIADEIVVVDSFSTDKTKEISIQYDKVRFIEKEFLGYGLQKQFAVLQAVYDYVLSLDADEEISTELKNSILTEKDKLKSACYSFNRRNFYCSKPIRFCGWYPDVQIRFFDRRAFNWNEKNVHETVDIQNKKDVVHLKGDLYHYTCTTIAEHQEKEKKYARINAQILANKNKNIPFFIPYVKGIFRFIKLYFLKCGFLDGYFGWIISLTLAKSSFYKYFWARKQLKICR